MIEDQELRKMFADEGAEHIKQLEDGLLQLEKFPGDDTVFAEVFRSAHSLKGAARMLGLTKIEMLAHTFETELSEVKKNAAALTKEKISTLYHMLDNMRKLVHEAVTDQPEKIAENRDEQIVPNESILIKSQEDPIKQILEEDIPHKTPENIVQSNVNIPVNLPQDLAKFQIETIRVDTKKLDPLITLVGELVAIKTRIARRISEIDAILSQVEDQNFEQLKPALNQLKKIITEDSDKLNSLTTEIDSNIRVIRLLPLSTIFDLFPRMVHDLAAEHNKEVNLIIEGGQTAVDKHILEEIKDPIMHIIRNSIDHGVELPTEREKLGKPRVGTIKLTSSQVGSHIIIEISDDGGGINPEIIKPIAIKQGIRSQTELDTMTPQQIQNLIFTPGFSTSKFVTEISGRGVGLNVVRTNIERLKGAIKLESVPGQGCTIRLQLPVAISTMRALIISISGQLFAFPVDSVELLKYLAPQDIFTVEGRETITLDKHPLSVASLAVLLEMPVKIYEDYSKPLPCVILKIAEERFGVFVDGFIGEQEIVLKPQSSLLKRVRNVSGATILDTGEICIILNPLDLLATLRKNQSSAAATIAGASAPTINKKKVVLLVEDSILTRALEKRILENTNYEVITAVDGVDALAKLNAGNFDAIISDVMMPNMGGLELTLKIRQNKKYEELPIILVTALASDEDKRKGLEVGANAYITKPAFDQKIFLETLRRLI